MKILKLSKFLWNPYEDINKKILLEMIETAKSEGFDIYRMEKDFYLTVFLILISRKYPDLVFKWWTCLNKIYYDYYRLSEDLDFVHIADVWRNQKKKILESYKKSFSQLFWDLWFTLSQRRTKHNEDQQWIFNFEYKSIIDGSVDKIKVDIRIEKQLLKPTLQKNIIAIYQDPISEQAFFQDHTIQVMNLDEIFAEKIRAALTRTEPAIRDFFDIHYAKQKWFDFESIKDLITQKLVEIDYKYIIDDIEEELKKQVKTELEPVLKLETDFDFNLPEIYKFILDFKPSPNPETKKADGVFIENFELTIDFISTINDQIKCKPKIFKFN